MSGWPGRFILSGCAAAGESGGAWWCRPLVFVPLDCGGACGAEGEAAEAVSGRAAVPAFGAGTGDAGEGEPCPGEPAGSGGTAAPAGPTRRLPPSPSASRRGRGTGGRGPGNRGLHVLRAQHRVTGGGTVGGAGAHASAATVIALRQRRPGRPRLGSTRRDVTTVPRARTRSWTPRHLARCPKGQSLVLRSPPPLICQCRPTAT
jgi:hypothetical protein